MNSLVVIHWSLETSLVLWTQMARSLVMCPALTVSMITVSRVLQKLCNFSLLSSLALCKRPLVHAKIEAMGLVEVSLPYWCIL